ncbi:MAG TPA: DMT family transporter [Phycisphaerae bacterium]|nr:DMT family transporter [Phycisphaerae bacterium]
MTEHLLGQTCALLAAITWAAAVVLFKRSGERISPLSLNLFKNTVAIVLLVVTIASLGGGIRELASFPLQDLALLAFSGVIGIALADTLFFWALNLVGVGIISIVDCAYSPLVIFASLLVLPEHLTPSLAVGTGLVLFGVFLSSRHKPPPDRTRAQVLLGVLLGLLALATMAVGVVFAKLVLNGNNFPLIWATLLRLLAGTIALALLVQASPQRRRHWSVMRPSAIWKVALPGSVLGGYFSMIFWLAGFKYTYASVAAILNQMSVVFAVILATIFLHEELTRRKVAAIVLALLGAVVVTWGAA